MLDYKYQFVLALALHVLLIHYGEYHDDTYAVPFTDVDYKVFTDAARYIVNGQSPYKRHTYRYTPLVAILLIPNVLLHKCFGKYLFSLVDIVIAFLVRLIVKHCLIEYNQYPKKNQLKITQGEEKPKRKHRKNKKNETYLYADLSMMLWLYNPLTLAVSTRGNCDSLAGLLVIGTLYLLQCKKQNFLAGIVHGIAIHIRLYPIAYSLAMFMYLSKFSFYSPNYRHQPQFTKKPKKRITAYQQSSTLMTYATKKTILKFEYLHYLIPNLEQIKLIAGCSTSLLLLTTTFYFLYGYTFLYETYLYHLFRRDTRHNFSMYFYLQYLTAGIKNINWWQKALTILPQLVLLLVFSVRYGLNKLCLNFSFLILSIVMVAYNTVLTSQYFVWILVVLPLCLWQIQMTKKTALFLVCIWFVAQGAWLLPAYLLEFQGYNTFMFIWVQSVSFFCANMAILGRIIKHFMPLNFFDCKII